LIKCKLEIERQKQNIILVVFYSNFHYNSVLILTRGFLMAFPILLQSAQFAAASNAVWALTHLDYEKADRNACINTVIAVALSAFVGMEGLRLGVPFGAILLLPYAFTLSEKAHHMKSYWEHTGQAELLQQMKSNPSAPASISEETLEISREADETGNKASELYAKSCLIMVASLFAAKILKRGIWRAFPITSAVTTHPAVAALYAAITAVAALALACKIGISEPREHPLQYGPMVVAALGAAFFTIFLPYPVAGLGAGLGSFNYEYIQRQTITAFQN
jgi:hypothetical protein